MLSTGHSAQTAVNPDAEQSWQQLRARVDGVRNRQRLKFFGTGVLAALAVFVAAFLGFSAADILFKLSVGSRVFVLLSTLIAIGFAMFYLLYRPLKKMGRRKLSTRPMTPVPIAIKAISRPT